MRRGVAGVTGALALALMAGAGTAHAQVDIWIGDERVPEGNSGTFAGRQFTVQTAGPPPLEVRVDWQLIAGSAKAGGAPPDNDFIMASGTLIFPAAPTGDGTEDINVQINGDLLDEWSPTEKQDQIFFIELRNPVNGTIQRDRAMIVLLEDDRSFPGLQYVSAAATGISGSGTVTLHWRVPAPKPDDILVRWNQGGGCTAPPNHTDAVTGGQFLLSSVPVPVNNPGLRQSFTHTSRPLGVKHCYSLFSVYGGTHSAGAEVASVSITPRDRGTSSIKWAYSTGSTSLVPSTVGMDAIYHVDQSGVVHAMQRSETGGSWPTTWNPIGLGKPAQTRSPVVPFPDGWRLFVGTDGGGIHAVDARDGHLIWSRSSNFGNALPSPFAQAPPALLLSAYGGNNDMLLVGTNNSGTSSFYAINPKNGIDQDTPITGLAGDVRGMAVVNYPARVFFLTSDPSANLYALNLGSPGAPALTAASLPGGNPRDLGSGSSLSPVLRNNRIFFGDSSGWVQGYDILTGAPHAAYDTGDGQVKGFLWPDRRNLNFNFYFSTNTKVHGIRDDGASFATLPWSPISSGTHPSVTSPSILLQKPGSDLLYFGNNLGQLVQVDLSSGTPVITPLTLEISGGQVGAPSLDGTHDLVIVGSAGGTIYAVHVPF
jgi:hypothetical protein